MVLIDARMARAEALNVLHSVLLVVEVGVSNISHYIDSVCCA